jgi:hypothetical protein
MLNYLHLNEEGGFERMEVVKDVLILFVIVML